MTGWLHRVHDGDDDEPRADPGEVAALLPSSVRGPEMNRFTPLGTDAPADLPDPDLVFFESIADQVRLDDGANSRVDAPRPTAANPRIALPDRDQLQAFREMVADRERETRSAPRLRVDHVELDDLLEDLATTAAALRQWRKAA
jgi:hypothetical protein